MFFTSKPFLFFVLGFILLLIFGQVFYGIDVSAFFNGTTISTGLMFVLPVVLFIGTIWVILFIVKNVWRSIK